MLGCDEKRLVKLLPVYNKIEQFPVHLIGNDQIEYVANVVSDHYHWTSVFLFEPIKSKQKDMRHKAFRLLKVICRLPLVSGERSQVCEYI